MCSELESMRMEVAVSCLKLSSGTRIAQSAPVLRISRLLTGGTTSTHKNVNTPSLL